MPTDADMMLDGADHDDTDTDGPRRGRPSKRALVVEAAVDEFLAKGYAGATLASIADRADVSTATVFKHFRTKADVFGAIMSRVFGNDPGEGPAGPLPSDDPEWTLIDIGLAYARLLSDPRIRALFRIMIAEVPRFPELGRELYEKGKKPYLDRLEAYLSRECVAGRLAIADVPLAARQFLGMINDVVFWPHQLVVDLPEADADQVVGSAAKVFARAYGRETVRGSPT